MLLDLLQPRLPNALERDSIGHVENQEHTIAALIEIPRDGPETLLTSCVPNLQFNMGFFPHDHAKVSKLHANRDSLLFIEFLMDQSLQNTCLAHSSVPNDYYFKKHVVAHLGHRVVLCVLKDHSAGQVVNLSLQLHVHCLLLV